MHSTNARKLADLQNGIAPSGSHSLLVQNLHVSELKQIAGSTLLQRFLKRYCSCHACCILCAYTS
jgi:hypothetical protein